MFYLVCNSIDERDALIQHLKRDGIMAVFHYQSLHSSNFYADKHDGRDLEMVEFYTSNLLRLPMFFELSPNDIQNKIAPSLLSFFKRT
jgi:dTDP-4-amino-4,6-dideoxygalactose transaminase